MIIKKAGSILIDKENKKIGLVYRKKHNDISFPKGHVEGKEQLYETAIRETIEETGRNCKLISNEPIYVNKYKSKEGEVENYMFLTLDYGIITEKTDEELIWVDISEVKNKLKYEELKNMWDEIYNEIEYIFNN